MQKLLTGEWRLDARFDKYDADGDRGVENNCAYGGSVCFYAAGTRHYIHLLVKAPVFNRKLQYRILTPSNPRGGAYARKLRNSRTPDEHRELSRGRERVCDYFDDDWGCPCRDFPAVDICTFVSGPRSSRSPSAARLRRAARRACRRQLGR